MFCFGMRPARHDAWFADEGANRAMRRHATCTPTPYGRQAPGAVVWFILGAGAVAGAKVAGVVTLQPASLLITSAVAGAALALLIRLPVYLRRSPRSHRG
ncbi:MAG: hypothetical protein RIC83_09695 [Alphaproteobacteria bacterium]